MTQIPDQLVDQLFAALIREGHAESALAFLESLAKGEPVRGAKPSPEITSAASAAVKGSTSPQQTIAKGKAALDAVAKTEPMSDEAFIKSLPSAEMIKLFNLPKDKREDALTALRKKHGAMRTESINEAAPDLSNDNALRDFFAGLVRASIKHGADGGGGGGDGTANAQAAGNNQNMADVHATAIDMGKMKTALQKLGVGDDAHNDLMTMIQTVQKSPDPKNPKFADPKQQALYKNYATAAIMATVMKKQ